MAHSFVTVGEICPHAAGSGSERSAVFTPNRSCPSCPIRCGKTVSEKALTIPGANRFTRRGCTCRLNAIFMNRLYINWGIWRDCQARSISARTPSSRCGGKISDNGVEGERSGFATLVRRAARVFDRKLYTVTDLVSGQLGAYQGPHVRHFRLGLKPDYRCRAVMDYYQGKLAWIGSSKAKPFSAQFVFFSASSSPVGPGVLQAPSYPCG